MLSDYSFGYVDISMVTDMVAAYIKSQSDPRFSIIKTYFVNSGREKLPDFLACRYLRKTLFPECPQSFYFK